ncbi:hypothetical protein A3Q56_07170 [Intoshia linei]|uniref:MAP kinase-activating death domain-containing protein n=1 Tax=Intoshia linei TaxID=1819745 RepID=A0A177ASY6_9BILA|nr:hypothetical protein A3Q56_07170 [Intoshia linei]
MKETVEIYGLDCKNKKFIEHEYVIYETEDKDKINPGRLFVSQDGIKLQFNSDQILYKLENVKRCFFKDENVIVIEYYDPINDNFSTNYLNTDVPEKICYNVLCIFSYIAAA